MFALVAQNPFAFWIFVGMVLVTLVAIGICVWFWHGISQLWQRAFLSGAGVTILELMQMKLRRTDAKLMVDCRIMSVQAKTPISLKELEVAHLSGADVELATRAFIASEKNGRGHSFEELVDASRTETLAAMMGIEK